MAHVDTLIDNRDDDLVAADGELVPDFLHIDVAAGVTGVDQMPLLVEIGIIERTRTYGNLRGHADDTGNVPEVAGRLGDRH